MIVVQRPSCRSNCLSRQPSTSCEGNRPIVLDGRDIPADPMYTLAKLGVCYLPQEPSVFRKLSVADNLRLVLELRPDLDRAGRERELESLMDELQVGHVADQAGQSLSGGERLRDVRARARAPA